MFEMTSKQKKRPHFWGHNSKEARGRKSGIVVEGAAFAEKAAWVEDSAIPKEEDQTHIACGLFSCLMNLHSPGQTRGLWQPVTAPIVSTWFGNALLAHLRLLGTS